MFAPVITVFMEWVIRSSEKAGLKRLYFLARDGWLWMRAAEYVRQEVGAELEFRYLCVSRKTLYGGSAECLAYLRQEGLYEETPYGIVDSGWIGTTKKSLESLIGKPIPGFYFGIYELPQGAEENSYHCFYFRPYRDIRRKAQFSICLFETVCSAPEGMTIGYETACSLPEGMTVGYGKNCNYVRPVCGEDNPNSVCIRAFARVMERYLFHVGKRGIDKERNESKEKNRIRSVRNVLSLLMGRPTKEEAEAFGTMQFDEGVEGDHLRDLAILWSPEEVKALRLPQRIRMKLQGKSAFRISGWQEGSIVRSVEGRGRNCALREERIYKGAAQFYKALRRMV